MKQTTSEESMWNPELVNTIRKELALIRDEMYALEASASISVNDIAPHFRSSAANLLHYLALRRHDIRPLQMKLASLGLSSLGRSEAAVLPTLQNVLQILDLLCGAPTEALQQVPGSIFTGRKTLEANSELLFGQKNSLRDVHIMVTMPSEAASDYLLVREMVAAGMDCMRINCAHDGVTEWERMIENLHRARRELGKKCRVLMDLGGPKLRTGPVDEGCDVLKVRPRRDRFGNLLEPGRIWLRPVASDRTTSGTVDGIVTVDEGWLVKLRQGDQIGFIDARGAFRSFEVTGEDGDCRNAEGVRTAYLSPGIKMSRVRRGSSKSPSARIIKVVSTDPYLLLTKGDILHVTRSLDPGTPASFDHKGKVVKPAAIGCTLPEVFSDVRAGDRIWFDDGKIAGIVHGATSDRLKVEILSDRPGGEKLRGEKGINLPDSQLKLSCITEKDQQDLKFIVKHAHMVGMSFIQDVADIHLIQDMVSSLGAPQTGIVLKIETRRGFEMLPDLLLAAMRSNAVGVMIARGDLAVECGYERLAEVQEEILWLCEAAHIPAIWATQVLETLAKSGVPSRAEITDAAMGERAECVMLNKGPHIIAAIRVLDNILQRMSDHQHKKSSMMRQLRWWENVHVKTEATESIQSVDAAPSQAPPAPKASRKKKNTLLL